MASVKTSTANVTWEGDLPAGKGAVTAESGAFRELPVSWSSRIGERGEQTTPEELIAAAHASCFSMAFAGALGKAGYKPERLETSATLSFAKQGEGFGIDSAELKLRAKIPEISADEFKRISEDAKENCPVSKALKGNVKLSLKADLLQPAGSVR